MPYTNQMRQIIESARIEDKEVFEEIDEVEEETDDFKESFNGLLEDLRDIVQQWEWHQELTENTKYNKGYEFGLLNASQKIKEIMEKYEND